MILELHRRRLRKGMQLYVDVSLEAERSRHVRENRLRTILKRHGKGR